MTNLTSNEVQFDGASVVDPAGRVFQYNNRIFRAIPGEYVDIYKNFLNLGNISEIFAAGLIETWVSEISLEGYGLVLEHKKIPDISCWSERCSLMAKDAAITTCKLNIELAKNGYITKDLGHDNIQFTNGEWVWIDFGSVAPMETHGSFRFKPFRSESILPIWLWSKGYSRLARALYLEFNDGYLSQTGNNKFLHRFPLRYHLIQRKAKKNTDIVSILHELLDYIEGLDVSPKISTLNGVGINGKFNENSSLNNKRANVIANLLDTVNPGLFVDLASHTSRYAELAISRGYRAISIHKNDESASFQYAAGKKNKSSNLPLVIDLLEPTPPWGYSFGVPSAYERFHAEVTLAIDVVHRLVLEKHVYFEPIIKTIASFTKKIAIIEFIPKDDPLLNNQLSDDKEWYSLSTFIQAAKKQFNAIEVLDLSPSIRKLVICSK
ncbi:MAG: hypothetical protein KDE48_17180 [Anaerolineales bacterium]|nr:hypothetical protein [Anaerolineales bacterium]